MLRQAQHDRVFLWVNIIVTWYKSKMESPTSEARQSKMHGVSRWIAALRS